MKFALTLALSLIILGPVLAGSNGTLRASQKQRRTPSEPSTLHSAPMPALVPDPLLTLAARADRKPGWSALAHYAAATRNHEIKGLAYFTLGYREYRAHSYRDATIDLARSASTGFSLADYAVYYQAAAASEQARPEAAANTLFGFSGRFPESTLRLGATRLLAWSLLGSNRPEAAIKVLQAAPELAHQAPLLYLLGEAYQKAGNLLEAARTFQDIYYRSPSAPEAVQAGRALDSLQIQLGTNYPAPSEDLRAARATELEAAGRFGPALSEYEELLRDFAGSGAAAARRLARDRCFTRLARTAEALADLSAGGWPPGPVDAERYLVILRARASMTDETGMLAALNELSNLYPQSPFYASALDSVAFYFIRQGKWTEAGAYSTSLVQHFPGSELAVKSRFQAAWSAYLAGQWQNAEKGFEEYAELFPSSRRAPAALYWLGRIAETGGRAADALSRYALLQERFRNQYYTLRSAERSKALAALQPPGAAATRVASQSDPRVPAALPAGLEAIRKAPATTDPLSLCPLSRSGVDERPALVLAALSLDDLAEHDLRLRLEAGNALSNRDSLSLRLALARVQRKREEYDRATYNARRILPDYADYDFSDLPADFWSLLYPEAFWSLVRQDARANRLDPYLVMALVREESGFNPKATSGAGARGLMQLLPQTARELAREGRAPRRRPRAAGNLINPNYNLRAGCRYLGEMVREFNGSLEQALAAYNAGPDRVKQWLAGHSFPEPAAFVESIPFAETRAYVEAILRDAEVYRRLMTERVRFKPCEPRS